MFVYGKSYKLAIGRMREESSTLSIAVSFWGRGAEIPFSVDQKLAPLKCGRTKVVATVSNNQHLEWWLLGYGDQVEVIAPHKLWQLLV